MNVTGASWTPYGNLIKIECECGKVFNHPAYISICRCPSCKVKNLWHGTEPKLVEDLPVAKLIVI